MYQASSFVCCVRSFVLVALSPLRNTEAGDDVGAMVRKNTQTGKKWQAGGKHDGTDIAGSACSKMSSVRGSFRDSLTEGRTGTELDAFSTQVVTGPGHHLCARLRHLSRSAQKEEEGFGVNVNPPAL